MAQYGKFTEGEIFYRYFLYNGKRYIVSYVFETVDVGEGTWLVFTPVKDSKVRRSIERASDVFLTWEELSAMVGDPSRGVPTRITGRFPPDDFSGGNKSNCSSK